MPRVLQEVSGIVGRRAGAAGSGGGVTVGTERDIPGAASVDIAVAVDGEVVPRADLDSTPLADGQRVEIVAAIQGGAR